MRRPEEHSLSEREGEFVFLFSRHDNLKGYEDEEVEKRERATDRPTF